MMDEDTHLKTGQYDPKEYWETRARSSNDNPYQAVCVFQYLDCLNAAAEKIQKHYLGRLVRATGLATGRALEFGCGVGRWVDLINENSLQFVGADISEKMLSYARDAHPASEFQLIDGVSLPFPDESFDLIYSVTVIHHNPFDRQDRILAEMKRVLRPGGYMIMLEDISHGAAMQAGFNMFVRSPQGWVQAVTKNSRLQLIEMQLIRWWVFSRPVANLLAAIYRLARGKALDVDAENGPYGKFVNAVVRFVAVLDLKLQPLLPRRFCIDAAMLFRKND